MARRKGIKFADIFESKQLDFTDAVVDVVDIFNVGAERINEMERSDDDYLDIVNRANEEQTSVFAERKEKKEPEKERELFQDRPLVFNDRPTTTIPDSSDLPTSADSDIFIPDNDDSPLESAGFSVLPKINETVDRGDFAFRKEARMDGDKLKIYTPPASDKNNREVAGFGDVTSPEKYKQLSSMVAKGDHAGAAKLAKQFLAERGKPYTNNIKDDKVASVVNGVVHHRGEKGLERIVDFLGAKNAGKSAGTKVESMRSLPDFQRRWIMARAKQERQNEENVWKSQGKKGTLAAFRRKRAKELGGPKQVFSLGNYGKGLYNRWLEEAKELTNK